VTPWAIQKPYDPYPTPAVEVATRLIALDGSGLFIKHHGDVKNEATAWAQYYLM
jgi:hypothetical protein